MSYAIIIHGKLLEAGNWELDWQKPNAALPGPQRYPTPRRAAESATPTSKKSLARPGHVHAAHCQFCHGSCQRERTQSRALRSVRNSSSSSSSKGTPPFHHWHRETSASLPGIRRPVLASQGFGVA